MVRAKKKVAKKVTKKRTSKKKAAKKSSLKRPPPETVNPSTGHLINKDSSVDFTDTNEVLGLIRDAITGKSVRIEDAKKAIDQVCHQHDDQSRVLLVAVAKAKINGIPNLMSFLQDTSNSLFNDPTLLVDATPAQKIKLLSLAYDILTQDLGYIRDVADMPLEMAKVLGVSNAGADLEKKVNSIMSNVPDPDSRTRIRHAIDMCFEAIADETKIGAKLIDVTPAKK